jgi:hypothetical protein
MGRASNRKRRQRPENFIRLAGEQAEVFDAQMDTDKKKFEEIEGCVYFRPQIPGEFNEQKMLGFEVPMIGPMAGFLPQQCTWTAVVDLGRAYQIANDEPPGKASGCRTRYKCPPALTFADQELYAQVAMYLALQQLAALRDSSKNP